MARRIEQRLASCDELVALGVFPVVEWEMVDLPTTSGAANVDELMGQVPRRIQELIASRLGKKEERA
jgi:hypothetical protein